MHFAVGVIDYDFRGVVIKVPFNHFEKAFQAEIGNGIV